MINGIKLKKIITGYSLNMLMLFILFLNLFPIGWMMYISFKGNSDIMSGNVLFKKADNYVVFLEMAGKNDFFIGTSDGAITRTDFSDATRRYYSLKSRSSAFFSESDAIWIASSDKGLVKVDKTTLKKIQRLALPRKALPTVELFKGKAYTSVVDVQHIGQVAITGSEKKLWLAAESADMRTLMEFDKETNRFDFIEVPDHFDFSIIKSISYDSFNNCLWIGTDTVVLRHDLLNKGFTTININNSYLPSGAQNIKVLSKHDILLQVSNGLYLIDAANNKVVHRYFNEDDITNEKEINGVAVHHNNIYLATNAGIQIVNPRTGVIINKQADFARIIKGNQVDAVALEGSEVRAISATEQGILIGANYGRVTLYNPEGNKILAKLQTAAGHFLEINSGWRNYIDMWPNVDFGRYLKNSLIICGFTMLIAMTLATMTAYALVRFKFPGVRLFSSSILVTQMIPAILYLIPLFMLFNMIKDSTGIMIKGTYPGLIFIYSAWFLPFSIWILRGFFAAIPVELEEAATIDGCSNIGVFLKITLPLAIPGIIATGIFILIQAWDELMFAWMLTSETTQTIPVGIRLFVGNFQNRYDLMMAAATIATIPVLILFFVLQKHIVRGLTAGAVKG